MKSIVNYGSDLKKINKFKYFENILIISFIYFTLSGLIENVFNSVEIIRELIIIAILFIAYISRDRNVKHSRLMNVVIVLYVVNLFFIAFISENIALTNIKDIRFYSYYLLFILIPKIKKIDYDYLFNGITVIGLSSIVYGIIDKLLNGIISVQYYSIEQYFRTYVGVTAIGTLGNRVNFAFYCCFLLALYLYGLKTDEKITKKNILIIILIIYGALLTFNRTSYLTSFITIIVFMKQRKLKIKEYFKISALLLVVYIIFENMNQKIFDYLTMTIDMSGRTTLAWPQRIQMILDKPFGYGYAHFGTYGAGVVDNSYLKTILVLGIQGILLQLTFFNMVIKKSIKNEKNVILLVPLILVAFTVDIYHIYSVMLFYYLIIGMIYYDKENTDTNRI